jgi:predicted PurR-regulated permease PerM
MTQVPAKSDNDLFRNWDRYFLLFLVIVSLIAAFKVIQPFIHALILAGLLASIFHPLYGRILTRVKGRENVASALTCVVVALIVIVPLTLVGTALTYKGIESVKAVEAWFEGGELQKLAESDKITALLESPAAEKARALQERFVPGFDPKSLAVSDRVTDKSQQVLGYLGGQVIPMLNNLLGLVLNFALMLFAMFYFLRDGKLILAFAQHMCPLSYDHERRLIERTQSVGRSAIVGTLITAGAQSALAMIAFAVVGIDWFFWGIMLGFASLIPVVGTTLVWGPAAVYLLATGDTTAAVGLTVYCIIVVGGVDNLLRPYLMQGDTGMSSMLLFFSIIGGIQMFGLIGVIYGPLIFGICAVLLYIYSMEVLPSELTSGDQSLEQAAVDPDAPPEPILSDERSASDAKEPQPDTPAAKTDEQPGT